ncbi:hypothetical protein HCH_04882 [Hahella chejuensis KCTC 2396]|uniref:Uncharacterized protein n=1 Tax=Hahella chejuensis (strain KCTC 2396) TaxID=349521 RepID=Q2SCQ1_HAHCH|nr:hypothetical protein HCH_04882 [Hahella chejuensis KCTC 2396]
MRNSVLSGGAPGPVSIITFIPVYHLSKTRQSIAYSYRYIYEAKLSDRIMKHKTLAEYSPQAS